MLLSQGMLLDYGAQVHLLPYRCTSRLKAVLDASMLADEVEGHVCRGPHHVETISQMANGSKSI